MDIHEEDAMKARYDADERRRRIEETRPKNAGVHSDQLKRQATRRNRRAAKQKGYGDE
jgi:hypothetical protein